MAKSTTKKTATKKPMIGWCMDFGFDSIEIRVTARTAKEARKKAIAKLKRKSVASFINRHTTFLDKE